MRTQQFVLRVPTLWKTDIALTGWLVEAEPVGVEVGQPVVQLGSATFTSPIRGEISRSALAPGMNLENGTEVAQVAVQSDGPEIYVLGLKWEWGTGVCLWSKNRSAVDRFDYQVDPTDLPISGGLLSDLERYSFLTSVGWQREMPGQEDSFGEGHEWRHLDDREAAEAEALAAEVPDRLREELGRDFHLQIGHKMYLVMD